MAELIAYLTSSGVAWWVVAFFMLLNLFKQPLATFLPQAWKNWYTDRISHKEEMEEAKLNALLQTNAADFLHNNKVDDNLVLMLQNVLQWQQGFCSDLKIVLERNTEALYQIKLTQERNNSVLTGLTGMIGKLFEYSERHRTEQSD